MRTLNVIMLTGSLMIQAQPHLPQGNPGRQAGLPTQVSVDTARRLECPMPVLKPLGWIPMPVQRPDSSMNYPMPVVPARCENPLFQDAPFVTLPHHDRQGDRDLLMRLLGKQPGKSDSADASNDTTGRG